MARPGADNGPVECSAGDAPGRESEAVRGSPTTSAGLAREQ
jgi:hypothetical protein